MVLQFGKSRRRRFGAHGQKSQQKALQHDAHGGLIRREFIDGEFQLQASALSSARARRPDFEALLSQAALLKRATPA